MSMVGASTETVAPIRLGIRGLINVDTSLINLVRVAMLALRDVHTGSMDGYHQSGHYLAIASAFIPSLHPFEVVIVTRDMNLRVLCNVPSSKNCWK